MPFGGKVRCICVCVVAGMAALEAAAAIHTLSHNASTAVALDDDYMVVGDDEDQVLRIYHRRIDGPPVYTRDFTASLGLTDVGPSGLIREVDIEASVRVGNRIYWFGSHGNCGGCDPPGELRPNRLRLFATDIVKTGTNYSLEGRWPLSQSSPRPDQLGQQQWAWAWPCRAATRRQRRRRRPSRNGGSRWLQHRGTHDEPHGHGRLYRFSLAVDPGSGRTNALIVPLLNLPQLVAGSPAPGPARFGKPIELFLDRRGIRSIDAVSNGYVIVAGTTTNSGSFRIYTWNGNTNQVPVERQSSFSVNQPEGLIVNGPIATGSEVQLISEGANDFSSEYVTIGHGIPELRNTLMAQGAFHFLVIGTPGGSYDIETSQNGGPWTYSATIGVPENGQANWTDFGAAATHRRLYRLRYPSR